MSSIVKRGNNFLPSFFQGWNDDFLSNFLDRDNINMMPAINVIETANDFKIEVAAPGLEKKDFKIKLDKNILEISAEKEIHKEEHDKDSKFLRKEFGHTSFSRSFNLPNYADTEKISASQKDGVLTVMIPKNTTPEARPIKEIDIK